MPRVSYIASPVEQTTRRIIGIRCTTCEKFVGNSNIWIFENKGVLDLFLHKILTVVLNHLNYYVVE